jgi:hypothetical protein
LLFFSLNMQQRCHFDRKKHGAYKSTLDDFKRGNWELDAQASVIVVKAEASKDASYDDGVAVFTMPKSGLMAEATVGGQKSQYTPKRDGSLAPFHSL